MSQSVGTPIDTADIYPSVQDDGLAVSIERLTVLPDTSGPRGGQPSLVQSIVDPDDGRDLLYAVDTRGVVWIVDDGDVLPTPFLDLRDNPDFEVFSKQAGLRSIAFHPDAFTPGAAGYGKVYAMHSSPVASRAADTPVFEAKAPDEDVAFHDVLVEFDLVDPSDPIQADAASRREILAIEEVFLDHNADKIAFDPGAEPGQSSYGLLYVGVGDGGGALDPLDQAQDTSHVGGSLLRIDPLAQADGATYRVPDDNPFIGAPNVLDEIWAYGLRHPQNFSFDDGGSGLLYLGDIGQSAVEEINIVVAGGNYGWDHREGPIVPLEDGGALLPPAGTSNNFQHPFTGYDHPEVEGANPFPSTFVAVAGGYVYRGSAVPALTGSYVFADFATGQLFYTPTDSVEMAIADGNFGADEFVAPLRLSLEIDGAPTDWQTLTGSAVGRADGRIAEREDGELLLFDKETGSIYAVGPSASEGPRVVALSPADDALTVDPAADLVLTFDRDVRLGASGEFRLVAANGTVVEAFDVASSTGLTVAGAQIVIDPSGELDAGDAYWVEIDAGAVEDLEGNAFAGITNANSWNFQAGGPAIGEFARLTLSSDPVDVTFGEAYADPVVVLGGLSSEDAEEASAKLVEGGTRGFTAVLDEPDFRDGVHDDEITSFLALEAGRHLVPGGIVVEAGRAPIGGGTRIDFSAPIPDPVVFVQLQGQSDDNWTVLRVDDLTSDGFRVVRREEEANQPTAQFEPESLGWIALSSGSAEAGDGETLEIGRSEGVTDSPAPLAFATAFGSPPGFLSGMQTLAGGNPAVVRFDALTQTGVQVQVAEETSADEEVKHVGETVGYVAFDEDGVLRPDPGAAPRLVGSVVEVTGLTEAATQVPLGSTFANPVVFAGPAGSADPEPVVVQLESLTDVVATLRLQEPSDLDGDRANGEQLSVLTLEEGRWIVGEGRPLEVGTLSTEGLTPNGFVSVTFAQPFATTPVVLTQLQSANGSVWATTRIDEVTATGFRVGIQQEEGQAQVARPAEIVGWLAIEAGAIDWAGVAAEAFTTADVINDAGGDFTFAASLGNEPLVNAAVSTFDGGDAVTTRLLDVEAGTATFAVQEETTRDLETSHTRERVSGLAFAEESLLLGVDALIA